MNLSLHPYPSISTSTSASTSHPIPSNTPRDQDRTGQDRTEKARLHQGARLALPTPLVAPKKWCTAELQVPQQSVRRYAPISFPSQPIIEHFSTAQHTIQTESPPLLTFPYLPTIPSQAIQGTVGLLRFCPAPDQPSRFAFGRLPINTILELFSHTFKTPQHHSIYSPPFTH